MALLVVLAWGQAIDAQDPSTGSVDAETQVGGGLAYLEAMQAVLADVIERTEPSVVSIARIKKNGGDPERPFVPQRDALSDGFDSAAGVFDPDFVPNEFGTGVIVDAAEGLVLTCHHVLGEGDDEDNEYTVTTIDRRRFRATIVGADPRSDLAILKIEGLDTFRAIKFGDAKSLKKGHFVIGLGNPYAIARDGQASASFGHVANIGRKAAPIPLPGQIKPTIHHYGTLIQTDARLNLGTSGGPLLNLKGEMVGLTTSLAALNGYEQSAGYAMPVDDFFIRAVETLKQGKEVEYGFLGVRGANISMNGVDRDPLGMRIQGVVEGTAASKKPKHVMSGDIVTRVNGQPVVDSDALMLLIGQASLDSITRLRVIRGASEIDLQTMLTKYRAIPGQIITSRPPTWRGIWIDYATAVLDGSILPDYSHALTRGCVGIRDVVEDSPAWREGLRPGMLITFAAGGKVATPKQFHDQVALKLGDVEIHAWANPGEQIIRTVQPE